MVDHPILFSGAMVRALLACRKTQTRRGLKFQPAPGISIIRKTIRPLDAAPYHSFERRSVYGNYAGELDIKIKRGDRLWVREEFSGPFEFKPKVNPPTTWPVGCDIWYWADGNPDYGDWTKPKRSMHMPRWTSRLTLPVTDVRVERLQDISEADAIAEGIEPHHSGWMPYTTAFYEADGVTPANYHLDPRESYRSLWNKINGFGAWEATPWVVAYTVSVIKQNIDQIEREAA
ncbi:hypothetical protein ASD52_01810 [Ensifer sp. Root142]|uniref:hypothetical protein n=1 Tax=Ensifer sp. Root142 TaxID=1736461 RepID=UPI00070900FF|nr:hypothetical protein [Ensifer sp. Root142]KQY78608.1 hypothetical protein ASD52_01810 [Ensifer sp. Root142]